MARADKRRKSGLVGAVAPADREALRLSLIATGGAVRTEKITRIRAQIRQGTYHIRAAEVAKAILRREPAHEGAVATFRRRRVDLSLSVTCAAKAYHCSADVWCVSVTTSCPLRIGDSRD